MDNKPLSNPKSYHSWEGTTHREENYQDLYKEGDTAPAPHGTHAPASIHGPKPRTQGDAEEVNNPTQGEQSRISSDWPSSKAHKR